MDFSNMEVTIDHIADAGAKIKAYATVRTLAEAGDRLGHKQHALTERRLTVAAVTEQADVANVVGSIAHMFYSFLTGRRLTRGACHSAF